MFSSKQLNVLAQRIPHGDNFIFLYCIPNSKMINYSPVPQNIFTKHSPKTSSKSRTSITSKSSSFDGVCGFKTFIICAISSKWLDTGLIIIYFSTRCASNLLLLAQHYLSWGRSAINNFAILCHIWLALMLCRPYASPIPSSCLFSIKTFLTSSKNQSFPSFHIIFVIFMLSLTY